MGLLSHQKPVIAALSRHFRSRETVKWRGRDIHPPIVCSASVSSGKSIMIAEIARAVKEAALSKEKPVTVYVLVLQRQSELVSQNSDAAWSVGLKNSIYSASLGKKSTHYSVIFATESTMARALKLYRFAPFTDEEMQMSVDQRAMLKKWHPDLILVDENHQVPTENEESQYLKILDHFYSIKPHIRLAGFTGSPFRDSETIIGDTEDHLWRKFASIEPGEEGYPEGGLGNGIISTEWMVDAGWVVPPIFGWPEDSSKQYDFSHLTPENWQYDEAELDAAVSDHETLLSICSDVIEKARDRKGVLMFCATQRHARQTAAALMALGVNENHICVITDKTNNKDRVRLIDLARSGEIKYTVNVSVLTTGVSVPYWDTLVFLRPIGSLVLLIQAIGRVLRLLIGEDDVPMLERDHLTREERKLLIAASDKPNALILDYADVMNTLGDLYENPVLEQADLEKAKKDNIDLIECPECATMNSPHARRCIGRDQFGMRCEHFWHFRQCPSCNTKNDQVARECRNSQCRRMLIDPNAVLNGKHYTDAESIPVRSMSVEAGSGGKLTIRYELADGRCPVEIYYPHAGKQKALNSRIWAGFVQKLPIPERKKYRLKAMKASTIMENLELIPVPVEISAREKGGKWVVGRRKYAEDELLMGEVV